MTATRIHIARIPAASVSFDDQAREILAAVTPAAPVWQVEGIDDARRLAEYVDLVEAGYGVRDARYRSAHQALERFVRRNWTDPACRSLCGSSAFLSNVIDQLLEEGAQHVDVAQGTHKAA